MSSRALRKLQKRLGENANYDDDNGGVNGKVNGAVSDSASEDEVVVRKQNVFNLLSFDHSDGEESENDDECDNPDETLQKSNSDGQQKVAQNKSKSNSKSKSNKKKKKKKNNNASIASAALTTDPKQDTELGDKHHQPILANDSVYDEEMRLLEAEIQRVKLLGNGSGVAKSTTDSDSKLNKDLLLNLLVVSDTRKLQPDWELRRIFGHQAVLAAADDDDINQQQLQHNNNNNNNNNRRVGPQNNQYKLYANKCILSKPQPHWPSLASLGLSMEFIGSSEEDASFRFIHSPGYQRIEMRLMDALQTMIPDIIMNLVRTEPSHTTSLLQMALISLQTGNVQSAEEFSQMAFFTFERSFHSRFIRAMTLSANHNARNKDSNNTWVGESSILSFSEYPNRLFYYALFMRCALLCRKGCWRTALETAKCVLRLDFAEDPLGMWLWVDLLALRCGEWQWIEDCWVATAEEAVEAVEAAAKQKRRERQHDRSSCFSIRQLPNWWFSLALARLKQSKGDASEALFDAILRFPRVALLLAERLECSGSTITDQTMALLASAYGEYDGLSDNSDDNANNADDYSLGLLLDELYVDRALSLWKEPDALQLFTDCMRRLSSSASASLAGDAAVQFLRRPCPLPDKRFYRHAYLTDNIINAQQQQQLFTKFLPRSLLDGPTASTPWCTPQLTLIDPLPPLMMRRRQSIAHGTPIDPYANYYRRRAIIKYPRQFLPWIAEQLKRRNSINDDDGNNGNGNGDNTPITIRRILNDLEIGERDLPTALVDNYVSTDRGLMADMADRLASLATNWMPWLNAATTTAASIGVGNGINISQVPGLAEFMEPIFDDGRI